MSQICYCICVHPVRSTWMIWNPLKIVQTCERSHPVILSKWKHGQHVPKAILEQKEFILAISIKKLPHENMLQVIQANA